MKTTNAMMASAMAAALVFGAPAMAAFGDGAPDLGALAREDYAHAVRPGGVDGSPFWNIYARMFMYPPAFDFSKGGPGTVKYRFTVFDAAGKTHVFDAPSSQSPLTPVWNDVAPGQAWVYVSAVDKDGKVNGIPDWPRDRFSRTFWRSAPFRPGAYPPAPRSYAEAVAKCGDEIFERPATQYFLRTGKPDPDYKHNCYPAKMHSALILGMLGYAERRPDRAADALKLARNAADFLISISQPKGAPLEYWPPTYADKREAGSFRYGQNMLIYPCGVGTAYLALYDRVKDAKYLDAAKRIADTYVRLQEADGTWPIFIRESDGKVLNENRVQPTGVITFLERLYRTCGDEKYRACGDRAFAWIEAHPLKDWFWEGQFEDSPLVQKYENPSKHPACELALYLLERFPGDQKWLAVARDILRYAEDQFVCWEKPCAANGHGVNTPIGVPSIQQNRYDDWFYPCVLEQYVYYVPVDASNAKLIRTYLAIYRAGKNPLDLAKARALGDALVRIQRPNGYIPTEYALVEKRDDPNQGWLNCSCAALSALAELAAAVGDDDEVRALAAADYAKPVRPIGVDGQPEWNVKSVFFMYPPTFGFARCDGAASYRFTVKDESGVEQSFTGRSPNDSLAPIWGKLPLSGWMDLRCEALDAQGGVITNVGSRSFWKQAPFVPGSYPAAKRSPKESAKLIARYVMNQPIVQANYLSGKPVPAEMVSPSNQVFIAYPSKMGAAVVSAMAKLAAGDTDEAKAARRLAEGAVAKLMSITEPEGRPLAGFPRTYEAHPALVWHPAKVVGNNNGKIMLVYPRAVANAYLDLYEVTKDPELKAAAVRIADRYLELQGEDGSWPLNVWLKDGQSVERNRLVPAHMLGFLERMYALTGDAKYRKSADRAFAYIEKGPLTTWNWEGQFEDVAPTSPYQNLTKHDACDTAMYLVRRFPSDQRRIAQAREIVRFAEDQFVCWERPMHGKQDPRCKLHVWDCDSWRCPAVLEQYNCYVPIDASSAKLIRTYLAMFRATKNPLDLARARALGDAIIRETHDDGYLPTFWMKTCEDWPNCALAGADALNQLASVAGE